MSMTPVKTGPVLLSLALLAISGCATSPDSATGYTLETPARPNIVMIITDDQGYMDVGFNGGTEIPTPNIDQIASGGVRFTRGYVSYPVCGPSRAGLMTGRYQSRFGHDINPTENPAVAKAGLPLDESNIAEVLDPLGYASIAIGKWHLGTHKTLRPTERGFDEFFGFLSGGHQYDPAQLTIERLEQVTEPYDWYRTKLLRQDEPVTTNKYLTDELSDAAVEFIDRRSKSAEPFFVYLAYNAPHTPLDATEEYLARFPDIVDPKRRTYAAMVSAVDDGVGRVLTALEEQGIADNTLVIFLSDNGGVTLGTPSFNNADNGPLRAGKGAPYEGGIRVPFAMRWPAQIPAGTVYDENIIALDILATIAGQTGAEIPSGKALDGTDLIPYLTGTRTGAPHDALYWRKIQDGVRVILEGDRKQIHNTDGSVEVYDLARDPSETRDLARKPDEAGRTSAAQARLDAWDSVLPTEAAFPPLGSWLGNWKDRTDQKEAKK